ncbi:MAG: hypothetical protein ACRDIY_22050 [Chloroflexota bacterium]
MAAHVESRRAERPDLDRAGTEPGDSRRSALVPGAAAALFVMLALISCVGRANVLLNSDGDLARHLRVGSYILARHALFYQDVFSYTMLGKPFVPYEWLSEVLYTVANLAGGLAGVAVLASLVIAATYALVTGFLVARSVDPLLAFSVGALAAASGALHWLARPHLFSALGAILTLIVLDNPSRRRLWPIVPIFILWANLHGGFLFGLVLIGVYVVGDLAEVWLARGPARDPWRQRASFHLKALGLALASCLVNPSGLGLFSHVTGYLGQRYLVDHTQEYASPNFHLFSTQIFIGVLLLTIATFALGKQRPSLPRLLLVGVDLAFALYSVRNIPLFAVTALPLVALELDPTWRELLTAPNLLAKPVRAMSERFARGERHGGNWGWPVAISLFLAFAAASHGTVAGVSVIDARFLATRFPVAAVQRARAAGLAGRMYNEFTWGGYILYAWPEQKVFIDGQTDFYGAALTETYDQIADLDPGWRDALRKWNVSLVIIPTDSRLADELEHDPGWSVWYRDQTAVILQRNG